MSGVNRGIIIRQLDRLWGEGSLTGLGEAQLLDRYRRSRDESAFEALVDRHGPMVLGLCRRMLRDPRDIEDAFQATFLVLVRKASGIRDGALLANWLYGVAYRVASRARRTRIRRGDREVSLELLSQPPAIRSTQVLINDLGPALDEELARLPDKYRAPIVLSYLNRKTHEQIAELLNCPVGTIHTRITRGRNMLRSRLTRRGFAPTAAVLSLSPSWSIPFTAETVPPSLIFATMNAVGQIGSSHAIKAGLLASSVVTLTQGAITSMHYATWKWAGLGLVATAVSASGVVAVGYTSVPGLESESGRAVALALPDGPQKIQGSVGEPVDERPSRTERGTDRSRAMRSNPAKSSPREQADPDTTIKIASLPELSTRLEIALDQFDVMHELHRDGQVSIQEMLSSRGDVLLAEAKFKGLLEELQDQLQQLEDQRAQKQRDLDDATRQKEVATSVVARNARLNKRKANLVPEADVEKAETELRTATSIVGTFENQIKLITERKSAIERLCKHIEELKTPFAGRVRIARSSYQTRQNPRTVALEPPVEPTTDDADATNKTTRPQATTLVNSDPTKATPNSSGTFSDPRFRPADGTTNLNLRLLQLQLERQLEAFERTPVNATARAETRREIAYFATVLDGMLTDLNEELEQLEVQKKVKQSELMFARSNEKKPEVAYKNTKSLSERSPAVVSSNEVSIYESELNAAISKTAVAEANLLEPQLRITQLTRKKERLQTLLNRATKILNQPTAAPSPSAPR